VFFSLSPFISFLTNIINHMQRKWKIGSEASNVCAIDSNVHPIDSIRSSKVRKVNSEASSVFSIDGIVYLKASSVYSIVDMIYLEVSNVYSIAGMVYLEASNVSSEIDRGSSICSTIYSNIEPKCTNIDT